MIKLTIRSERCKACGLCIAHCPKQLLHPSPTLNETGYHTTMQSEPEKCNGCAICALMCPDICYTIIRTDESAEGTAEVAQ
jgi:2-oxoglutarate ferredoxin oxidoreductase subunit delta